MLNFITEAADRMFSGDANGIAWTWHNSMTPADRVRFDLWLVKTRHPLQWQAGTPFSRFSQLVNRMVDLERERLEATQS